LVEEKTMALKLEIYNLALSYLGSPTITNVTQNIRSAQALNAVYEQIKRAELRKKPSWNFAIKLVSLSANAITPVYGRANAFPLPTDFIGIAPQLPELNYNDKDWLIQDRQIYTRESGTLSVRYVANVDESLFDPLFANALSARLAVATCYSITQSQGNMQNVIAIYKDTLEDAKKSNAFDNVAMQFPEDPWITARY
jgi:hypothetical protein